MYQSTEGDRNRQRNKVDSVLKADPTGTERGKQKRLLPRLSTVPVYRFGQVGFNSKECVCVCVCVCGCRPRSDFVLCTGLVEEEEYSAMLLVFVVVVVVVMTMVGIVAWFMVVVVVGHIAVTVSFLQQQYRLSSGCCVQCSSLLIVCVSWQWVGVCRRLSRVATIG